MTVVNWSTYLCIISESIRCVQVLRNNFPFTSFYADQNNFTVGTNQSG